MNVSIRVGLNAFLVRADFASSVKYVGIGTESIFSNAAGAIYVHARIAEEIVFNKSWKKGTPL
jgi:hypothetical protein